MMLKIHRISHIWGHGYFISMFVFNGDWSFPPSLCTILFSRFPSPNNDCSDGIIWINRPLKKPTWFFHQQQRAT